MSSTDAKLMTVDDLLALPDYVDGSDRRYELIRGELRTMSPTKPLHGVICGRLTVKVGSFVEEHELGEVFGAETGFLVQTDPDSIIAADLAFVSKERLATAETLEKFFPFAPDLTLEVLSPSNTVSEIDEKIALYFAAGSLAVWIFNPMRRTVAVYRSPFDVRILGEQDMLDGGEVLPEFTLDLSRLFAAVRK
jgi:Uma2 family endonuclease